MAGNSVQLAYALAIMPGFIAPSVSPYGGALWWWACLFPPSAASMFAGERVFLRSERACEYDCGVSVRANIFVD